MDPFKGLNDLLPILVFLLPGFLSSGIVSMLVVRKPRETFDKCIEALIFTTINLAVFAVGRSGMEMTKWVSFDRRDFFSAGNLSLMTAVSVFIGLAWAYEATNEYVFRFLRWLRVTRKTLKVSTWSETFVDNQKFVIVHLKDDRRIYGWPRFYSDDPSERAVFLENASWLTEDNQYVNQERISILLDKESGILLIEFLNFSNEQASPRHERTAETSADRPERTSSGSTGELAAAAAAALPAIGPDPAGEGETLMLPPSSDEQTSDPEN